MSNNFWNQEDSVSEYDLLKDSYENAEEQSVTYEDIDDTVIENIQGESAFDLNEEEVSVVYNARLRLEQARLYEMLINHNLFEGVDADANAIKNVQNELKEYIVYRLEILLGLRKTKVVNRESTESNESTDARLNDVEVDFLKQLAYKGTRGASILQAPEEQPRQQPVLNTIPSSGTKSNKLRTLANPKPQAPIKKIATTTAKQVAPSLTKKTAPATSARRVPVKSTVVKSDKPVIQQKIKSGGQTRILTPQEADQLAREDLQKTAQKKTWVKMSAKEKAEEVRRVNARHARVRPEGVPDIPSPEQQEMMYMRQQQRRSMDSGNATTRFNEMLANAILISKRDSGE
jgi:hypothetical protein